MATLPFKKRLCQGCTIRLTDPTSNAVCLCSDLPRMAHVLKLDPEPFRRTLLGQKRHEVRVYDRDYRPGDQVRLYEYDRDLHEYSGRRLDFTIGYVSEPGTYGLPDNIVVFTLLLPLPERYNLLLGNEFDKPDPESAYWRSKREAVQVELREQAEALAKRIETSEPYRSQFGPGRCNHCGAGIGQVHDFGCPYKAQGPQPEAASKPTEAPTTVPSTEAMQQTPFGRMHKALHWRTFRDCYLGCRDVWNAAIKVAAASARENLE